MPLLALTHQQQRRRSDCLAACAAMVLDYLGVQVRYSRLTRILRIRDAGTSFYNLRHLSALGVSVLFEDGDMVALEDHITNGHPVIASVDTQDLRYWQGQSVLHAVVIVGLDANTVSLHDPAFPNAPQVAERIAFESAWLRRDYVCAIVQPESVVS